MSEKLTTVGHHRYHHNRPRYVIWKYTHNIWKWTSTTTHQESNSSTLQRKVASYVEQLLSSQGQSANAVYFAQLAYYSRRIEHYLPAFTYDEGSKKPKQVRGRQWNEMMFETSMDVYDEDLELFKSVPSSPADLA